MSNRLAVDLQLSKRSDANPTPRLRRSVRPSRAPASRKLESRGHLRFLSAFLREPFKVGAFWPSSMELSRQIVEGCELHRRHTVVELGPGTGAFTGLILEKLRRNARFFAVELSLINVKGLQKRFPGLDVYGDSAEQLPKYLRLQDRMKADCIISGLAWGNMLPATQNRIFDAVLESLAPGGLFTTFAYVHARWLPTSVRFRQRLFRHFSRIEVTPIVWRNLPPAFVYRCWQG